MKNPYFSFPPALRTLSSVAFLAFVGGAQAADLTWTGANPATWDVATTANWDNGGATTWTNGDNAIFGDAGANYTVDLDTGVTVTDLTYEGTDTLWLKSLVDNTALTLAGDAAWDTGGGSIRFLNNQANDTALDLAGNTLTVSGGGLFDTGEKANGADWGAGNLVFSEATQVYGAAFSIGQLTSVSLAGGSSFRMERNSDQTLANDWVLGAGSVVFDNRYNRNFKLTGDISGAGGMKVQFLGLKHLEVEGNNTFTGDIEVSTSSRVTFDQASLGTAGDITLSGNGTAILRLLGGVNLGSRTLTLNDSGGVIVNAGANSLAGNITGAGGLTVGDAAFGGNVNVLTLNGTADHTGVTNIFKGAIALGADDAMSSVSVLDIGGTNGGTSQFTMAGFDAEIAGLTSSGSNTKVINNTAASDLTINVASGSYTYAGNFNGAAGATSIVKTGDGTQIINRGGGFSASIGNLTANAGKLIWDANGNTGSVSVASGATLEIGDGGASGVVGSGAAATSIGDANIANAGALVINRNGAVTYDGVISGTGSLKASTGDGALTLSAAQTYTGTTTLDKSVLTAGVANVLSSESVLAVGGGGSGISAFEMNGLDQQAGGLTFIAGFHTREVRNNGADATLTLDVAASGDHEYNANFSGSGAINLVKNGVGTQTLNRSGGYTTDIADITVTGGELIWNVGNSETTSNTGSVTVGAAGTLSGSGSFGGAVNVSGDLNPGNSPGTMTFYDDLTLESTATLTLEFTSTTAGEFDVLANDGGDTFTAAGTLALTLLGYTATVGDTFQVLDNWAGYAGSFSSTTGTDLGGGLSFDTSTLLSDGKITVIPEPSAALLGCFGVLALLRRRRG